jgi:hypothetical protein
MANPERGEVALVVAGRAYTLKLSMNAAVTLERKLKKRIGQIMQEASALSFESIRLVVWLLLQKHHAEDFTTEDKAGELIDDAGGVQVFFSALQALTEANQPEGVAADPPEAQDGTGERSTSPPDVSA